ncbi:hypothetical protein [Ensifer aridi]|uniref:hypothetical protein n=1 Tax=Ensifer aridi TaxID=1708715 RepID=UPI00112516AC|nr:hypothetical protein [Ensifer aridi]
MANEGIMHLSTRPGGRPYCGSRRAHMSTTEDKAKDWPRICMKCEIESLMSDEQDYYDNMPESFQNGEKGERAQSAIDALQEAYDSCETAFDALGTAVES